MRRTVVTVVEETQAAVTVSRGECRAPGCKVQCEAYVFGYRLDGYSHCTCGHTDHIHVRLVTMNHGDADSK
jgi:hypothetical protein